MQIRDRSLFIACERNKWFLGEQKRGSVVTENPKWGIAESFGRIQRGTTQICLENEGMGMGGDRESHQNLLGGITSVK